MEAKFLCSRVERGVSICLEQCSECRVRQAAPRQPDAVIDDSTVSGKVAEPVAAQVIPGPGAGPKVQAQITIVLYEDGNAQVNGPFDDRILFHGLLFIASDVERRMYEEALKRNAAQQHKLATMPWWKRKLLERQQKQAARAQLQASAKADELTRAAQPK